LILLDGKLVSAKVLDEVRTGVAKLRAETGVPPTLAVVLVGEDPASQVYVRNKKRTAESLGIASPDFIYPKIRTAGSVGIASPDFTFPEGLGQADLLALVDRLNADPSIHGILVQLPLPKVLDEAAVIARIAPEKDVDGLTATNLGNLLGGVPSVVPCTPAGCMEVLDHYGAPLAGAEAVVVGRSRLVGKPLAQLLLARHATVTMCHTRTRDLAFHTRRADILCVAAGRPRMVTGDMVKPGAWVIDVGVNRLETGKLAGDVDFASASEVAHAITPVPGGIGPMTIAMLMKNTLMAATRQVTAR
jgi:methylenetetrahydrofolate dehydrogenase (NADP+)/methenyltetrahydrofolate cyclohydrolase